MRSHVGRNWIILSSLRHLILVAELPVLCSPLASVDADISDPPFHGRSPVAGPILRADRPLAASVVMECCRLAVSWFIAHLFGHCHTARYPNLSGPF